MSTLDRAGFSLHYEVHGAAARGTPLLLSHGFSASTEMWRPNLPALSAERPVVTWDVRGHGRSESPADLAQYSEAACVSDMAAVLDACGIERAAVGGLSLGGYLSLAFHVAHPGRVAALLLFDTGPGFHRPEPRARWNRWAEAQAEALERQGLDALSGGPEVVGAGHDPHGLARAARGILRQDDSSVIDSLASIEVPTLVLVGADDTAFLRAADYMVEHIPGAVRCVLDGAGHAANLDQPVAFDEAVTAFLGQLDGPDPGVRPG